MDLGIAGKKALVTAASRGFGRACAISLAREGAQVTIVARRPEPLAETARSIGEMTGAPVTAVSADIVTEEGARGGPRGLSGAGYPDQQRWRPAPWRRLPGLGPGRLDRGPGR